MESPAPGKNALRVLHLRLFFYPAGDIFITDTGSNELFEFFRVDSSKAEEHLVKRTVVVVGSGSSREFSPAFIQRSGGNRAVTAKRSAGTAGSETRQIKSDSKKFLVRHRL